MCNIGCHISSAGGFLAMGKRAKALGADTFAFFTRNPRGGAAARADSDDAKRLIDFLCENNFGRLVAHAPYTLNPCSDKENVRIFAEQAFSDDLKKMELLPNNMYNFHPGSHVGQGTEKGIELITELLNDCLYEDMTTTVLLETMAGKGSEVGGRFEELRDIISGVRLNTKLGVCLDTCHVWDAGYDIASDMEGVLNEFDKLIGIDRLCALHINNSMNPLSSHKDRHARLIEGKIPMSAFESIVRHPVLSKLPMILETPNDDKGYTEEIAYLRSLQY